MFVVRTVAICGLACVLLAATSSAAEPESVLLWPTGAPGALGEEPEDRPELRLYPVASDTGATACVLVCPGGGYGTLAYDHEGQQVARWLNSIGVTAAVLKYRLGPKYRHPIPLQDAQRGLRWLRHHAQDLKIDPGRLGIMGFSAGGHLASTVSTHFDSGQAAAEDPVERYSSRPDFAILAYPVISFRSPFTHRGSVRNLLGDQPEPAVVESLSTETRVTEETPPTFLFHTGADVAVPVQNSLVYYAALVEKGVPAELHVYQRGPHGVGLAPGSPVLSTWKKLLENWLRDNEILDEVQRASVSGSVQHRGEEVRWGTIAFEPVGRPDAPVAWGRVSRGLYRLENASGPVIGPNRVVVHTMGSVEPRPTIDDAIDITGRRGDWIVDIRSGENVFDLDIR